MPDVLIRNVPEPVLERLKTHARENRQSLQQELLAMAEAAAYLPNRAQAIRNAEEIRKRLAATGVDFGDSTPTSARIETRTTAATLDSF